MFLEIALASALIIGFVSIISFYITKNLKIAFILMAVMVFISTCGFIGNALSWQHGEIKNVTIENKTNFNSTNGILSASVCLHPTCYRVDTTDNSWYYINNVNDYNKMEINKSYVVSIAHNDDIQIAGPEHTLYIEGVYYG